MIQQSGVYNPPQLYIDESREVKESANEIGRQAAYLGGLKCDQSVCQ